VRTTQKLAEVASPTPTQISFNGGFILTYDGQGQRMMKYRIIEK